MEDFLVKAIHFMHAEEIVKPSTAQPSKAKSKVKEQASEGPRPHLTHETSHT